jgi:hypothetical protein
MIARREEPMLMFLERVQWQYSEDAECQVSALIDLESRRYGRVSHGI